MTRRNVMIAHIDIEDLNAGMEWVNEYAEAGFLSSSLVNELQKLHALIFESSSEHANKHFNLFINAIIDVINKKENVSFQPILKLIKEEKEEKAKLVNDFNNKNKKIDLIELRKLNAIYEAFEKFAVINNSVKTTSIIDAIYIALSEIIASIRGKVFTDDPFQSKEKEQDYMKSLNSEEKKADDVDLAMKKSHSVDKVYEAQKDELDTEANKFSFKDTRYQCTLFARDIALGEKKDEKLPGLLKGKYDVDGMGVDFERDKEQKIDYASDDGKVINIKK